MIGVAGSTPWTRTRAARTWRCAGRTHRRRASLASAGSDGDFARSDLAIHRGDVCAGPDRGRPALFKDTRGFASPFSSPTGKARGHRRRSGGGSVDGAGECPGLKRSLDDPGAPVFGADAATSGRARRSTWTCGTGERRRVGRGNPRVTIPSVTIRRRGPAKIPTPALILALSPSVRLARHLPRARLLVVITPATIDALVLVSEPRGGSANAALAAPRVIVVRSSNSEPSFLPDASRISSPPTRSSRDRRAPRRIGTAAARRRRRDPPENGQQVGTREDAAPRGVVVGDLVRFRIFTAVTSATTGPRRGQDVAARHGCLRRSSPGNVRGDLEPVRDEVRDGARAVAPGRRGPRG